MESFIIRWWLVCQIDKKNVENNSVWKRIYLIMINDIYQWMRWLASCKCNWMWMTNTYPIIKAVFIIPSNVSWDIHIFLLDFYLLKMKKPKKTDKQYLCILLTLLSYLCNESNLFHTYLRPVLQCMFFKAFIVINPLWNFLSAFQQIKTK